MKKRWRSCIAVGMSVLMSIGSFGMNGFIVYEQSEMVHAEETEIIAQGTSNEVEWTVDSKGLLTISGSGDLEEKWVEYIEKPWTEYSDYITKARITVQDMTNASYLFRECTMLQEVDTSQWGMENLTDMKGMFYNCNSLNKLDVSQWDVGNVTNMEDLFWHCSVLTDLNVSQWDVSNVMTMSNTFSGCDALTYLDVSNWDVSSVTTMNEIFSGCVALTNLDISNWNVSNVTDMGEMFRACNKLESLDVSKWDVSNVTNMYYMFMACSELTSLDVSKWNVSNVNFMQYLFANCKKITDLDVSQWNLGKVIDIRYMFFNCEKLSCDITLSTDVTTKLTSLGKTYYEGCFENAAITDGSKISVFYTGDCSKLAAGVVVGTKSENSHVYLNGIEPVILTVNNCQLKNTKYQYTGKAIIPDIIVTYDGKELIEGESYTVEYSNNIFPGMARAMIQGINEYEGTVTLEYQIVGNPDLSVPDSAVSLVAKKNNNDTVTVDIYVFGYTNFNIGLLYDSENVEQIGNIDWNTSVLEGAMKASNDYKNAEWIGLFVAGASRVNERLASVTFEVLNDVESLSFSVCNDPLSYYGDTVDVPLSTLAKPDDTYILNLSDEENIITPQPSSAPEQSETPVSSKTPEQSEVPVVSISPDSSATPVASVSPIQSEKPDSTSGPVQGNTGTSSEVTEKGKDYYDVDGTEGIALSDAQTILRYALKIIPCDISYTLSDAQTCLKAALKIIELE